MSNKKYESSIPKGCTEKIVREYHRSTENLPVMPGHYTYRGATSLLSVVYTPVYVLAAWDVIVSNTLQNKFLVLIH